MCLSLSVCVCVCDSELHHLNAICPLFRCCCLTLSEAGRVVVDVGEADVNHRCPGETSSLSRHVFGFDHHLVVLPLLAVHVALTQGCPDHT